MSSSATARKEDIPIPEMVIDPTSGNRYMKGKFLGKGGFARCYELTEMQSKEVYAGKIVSKQLLTKQHQKEKVKNFLFALCVCVIINIVTKKKLFLCSDDTRNSHTSCGASQAYSRVLFIF